MSGVRWNFYLRLIGIVDKSSLVSVKHKPTPGKCLRGSAGLLAVGSEILIDLDPAWPEMEESLGVDAHGLLCLEVYADSGLEWGKCACCDM